MFLRELQDSIKLLMLRILQIIFWINTVKYPLDVSWGPESVPAFTIRRLVCKHVVYTTIFKFPKNIRKFVAMLQR